jgi:hypothetical protein
LGFAETAVVFNIDQLLQSAITGNTASEIHRRW